MYTCYQIPCLSGLDDRSVSEYSPGVNHLRKQVGRRVKALRLARKLTQEQLGERASLSYKFVGEIERGIGNPTIETLANIATALGVNIVDLVNEVSREAKYEGRQVTEHDYVAVREARDALDVIVQRLQTAPARRTKPRQRPGDRSR